MALAAAIGQAGMGTIDPLAARTHVVAPVS